MDINTKITPAIVAEHGLSEEEYQIILDRLGREPIAPINPHVAI